MLVERACLRALHMIFPYAIGLLVLRLMIFSEAAKRRDAIGSSLEKPKRSFLRIPEVGDIIVFAEASTYVFLSQSLASQTKSEVRTSVRPLQHMQLCSCEVANL